MKKSILIAALLLLAGCASSSGVQVTPAQTQDFKAGVTTEAQIIAQLGTPTTVLMTREGKVLVYSNIKHSINGATFIPVVGLFAGGSKTTGSTTTIFLNPDSTMKIMDTSYTQINASMGR